MVPEADPGVAWYCVDPAVERLSLCVVDAPVELELELELEFELEELDDAEEEKVQIVINHAPKEFVLKDGKLVGMVFEKLEWKEDDKGKQTSTVVDTVVRSSSSPSACRAHIT